MAQIVDVGITNKDIGYTIKMGLLMLCMALVSLSFGLMLSKLLQKLDKVLVQSLTSRIHKNSTIFI